MQWNSQVTESIVGALTRSTVRRTSRLTDVISREVLRLDLLGVIVAVWWFWQSLSPSLLPRTWIMQGVLSGTSAIVGYFAGWLVSRIVVALRIHRRFRGRVSDTLLARLRWALLVGAIAVSVYVFGVSARQQEFHWESMDLSGPERFLYSGVVVITVAICIATSAATRVVRTLRRKLSARGQHFLPRWIAAGVSTAIVGFAAFILVNDVLYDGTLALANRSFSISDVHLEDDDPDPPQSPLRTAGPGSQVSWESLGTEGRRFLAYGPSARHITELSGAPAIEPIRIFVGRASADRLGKRVDLLLEEMDRTGAFGRSTIVINIPTGTGWTNEQNIQPVEYLLGGDTATVSMQYSHLPSALAFLSERDEVVDTAKAVLAAIENRFALLPAASRPALFVVGESLGAFGGQGAFTDLDDMEARIDHALWVGTPGFTAMRKQLEAERLPGSRQMYPVVGDGKQVVFAGNHTALEYTRPKIVYLQNADDPIAWWDPAIATKEPDWMSEELDPSINPAISWGRLRTFLQISLDTAVSNSFIEGDGHLYGTLPVTAWDRMLTDSGWDEIQINALSVRLAKLPNWSASGDAKRLRRDQLAGDGSRDPIP